MNKKEAYVRRGHYQEILDKNTSAFRSGNAKNIALLGSRKCGKTSIIKEYLRNAKDVVPIYIDLGKTSLNPENFSVEFVGNIIFHFLKKPLHDYKKYSQLENIVKEKGHISPNAFSLVKNIENELLKIKPDQRLIVESAFKFAETWGHETGKKFIIAIDNFENLFDLNNFSQIKDVLSLMGSGNKNACYIAASSAVRQSLALLKNFECYEIKNLEKKEAIELSECIIGKNDQANSEIFEMSQGHPYATILISRKYNETKDAKKAFLLELLQKNHSLYDYCSDSFEYYYNRARGQTLLKAILKIIANDGLRLSDIAKKVYRSAPVTKSILERLMDADMIHKKESKFYFSDEILRLWVKLTTSGYDFDETPDDKILDEAMKEI